MIALSASEHTLRLQVTLQLPNATHGSWSPARTAKLIELIADYVQAAELVDAALQECARLPPREAAAPRFPPSPAGEDHARARKRLSADADPAGIRASQTNCPDCNPLGKPRIRRLNRSDLCPRCANIGWYTP